LIVLKKWEEKWEEKEEQWKKQCEGRSCRVAAVSYRQTALPRNTLYLANRKHSFFLSS
jgi:hypothetical protein